MRPLLRLATVARLARQQGYSKALTLALPKPPCAGLTTGRHRQLSSAAAATAPAPSEEAAAAQEMSADTAPGKTAPKAETKTYTKADAETHEFKTETRKLLDIVANSLYTEKEIFCRELISNASDAIEKKRLMLNTQPAELDESVAATEDAIKITLDTDAQTFTLQDTGIGMTLDELHAHLGTIAKSGSKAFVEANKNTAAAKEAIIGQFGVGFYSAFMVGYDVEVYTRSAMKGSKAYKWSSQGLGKYHVSETDAPTEIGTRIVIHIKDDAKEYLETSRVEAVIKQYSNFVTQPITVNGNRVNTLEPLWTMSPSSVTKEQHSQFYKFISQAWDEPQYTLQYAADAPLQIRTILYIPQHHGEMMGMGRIEPGISLYCRKVLIQAKTKHLLPEYLRFVKGVVDSEDLPLNLSREMLQDSTLIGRLRSVLTNRILKWLNDEAKRDNDKYQKWYESFNMFIKEGVCMSDPTHKKQLSKLLRYPTSKSETPISLAEYVDRMKEGQKAIYYVQAPTRAIASDSPFVELFEKDGTEVLYLHNTVDEFVTQHLTEFDGHELASVEKGRSHLADQQEETTDSTVEQIQKDQWPAFQTWATSQMGSSLAKATMSVKVPMSVPAVLIDHETPAMRNLMRQLKTGADAFPVAPNNVEFNARHPIIIGLDTLRATNPAQAKKVLEQVIDNAVISAGLMEDPRTMVRRLNSFLEDIVAQQQPQPATEKQDAMKTE